MVIQYQGNLFVWLMVYVTLVIGDYTIVTRIHSYTNPTNTGQNRGPDKCCDSDWESDGSCTMGKCDSRFTFCLRELYATSSGRPNCVGQVLSSEINTNDAPVDYTVPRWLGLDNPLRLNGLNTAWQGTQVFAEVHDKDVNQSGSILYQLIDRWTLNKPPSAFTAGANFSTPAVYAGDFDFGFLELSFRFECAEFYHGTFCEHINECLSQSINCNRGNCVDGEGFATCSCDPGYTGERCEVDIDECAAVNCSGTGVCVDGVNSFSCYCVSGFTGEVCSVEEQGVQVSAAVAGGVIGGVVVILFIIVLTAIITAVVVRSKAPMHPPRVEPQLMYDYVDPASITGQSDGIEMKPNEVYTTKQNVDFEMKPNEVYISQQTETDDLDFGMKTNNVYGVQL